MKSVEVRANLTYKFTMDIPDDQSIWDTLMDSKDQDPYWHKLKKALGHNWVMAETVDIVDKNTGELVWPQNLW